MAQLPDGEVTVALVHALRSIPPLATPTVQAGLIGELKAFRLESIGVAPLDDVRPWWLARRAKLPYFFDAVSVAILLQPSSAMCERVFSRLVNMFQPNQFSSMADYIEGSVLLAHNQAWRAKDH